jgi:membrane protease subunit HflK
MPWNDNANGGGPWGQGPGGPRNPWGPQPGGQPPNRPPPRGPQGGGQGPDLDEMMRRLQDRLRQGGGGPRRGGGGGGDDGGGPPQMSRNMMLGVAALVAIGWLATGVYTVDAGEEAVVTRFGKFVRTSGPGIHVHLPSPVEAAEIVNIQRVNQLSIGDVADRGGGSGQGDGQGQDSNLMLTQDENIVDIGFQVFWRIDNSQNFLFNVVDPEDTVRAVAEAAMRETVGRSALDFVLTRGRSDVESRTRELIQRTLSAYGAGIQITQVNLRRADPPSSVRDAFLAVNAASQEAETLINQATTYRNQIVPQARGEAARFNQLYQEYRLAPDVTRQRIYLETLERVYSQANKVMIEQGSGGQNSMIVLPPDILRGMTQAPPAGERTPQAEAQTGGR